MNPMITNLVLMLVVNKFSGKLDFEDPKVVNTVRGCYIGSCVIVMLIYFYCKQLIIKKNDLTTLKYEKPGSMFNPQETKETITTTNKAYDLEQISSAFKGALQGIAMMGFMHLYMKYTNPLVLQSIMPLKSALEAPIVQIHLLGKTGAELKRPFTAPSMFGAPETKDAAAETKEEPKIAAASASASAAKPSTVKSKVKA